MNTYFEVKATYLKQNPKSGKFKKTTESYLIDAITFSESEERIHAVLNDTISGEFTVKSIAKSNVCEAVDYETGELWFKVKLKFIDVDPDTGKEKPTANYLLVKADTTKEAYDRCQEYLKNMIVPFTLPSITETKILEVLTYNA